MMCRAGPAACEREEHGEAWSHVAGRAQKGCGKEIKGLARLPSEGFDNGALLMYLLQTYGSIHRSRGTPRSQDRHMQEKQRQAVSRGTGRGIFSAWKDLLKADYQ